MEHEVVAVGWTEREVAVVDRLQRR